MVIQSYQQEVEFKEESEYSKGEGSIKEVVIRHIKKISDLACQEFTGGYWQKRPIKVQSGVLFTEEYHEDVREAYCNAIDFLVDVVYPKADDDFRKYIDTTEKIDEDIPNDLNDKDKKSKYMKEKVKQHRKTFKQINIMFNRTNFFKNTDSGDE